MVDSQWKGRGGREVAACGAVNNVMYGCPGLLTELVCNEHMHTPWLLLGSLIKAPKKKSMVEIENRYDSA